MTDRAKLAEELERIFADRLSEDDDCLAWDIYVFVGDNLPTILAALREPSDAAVYEAFRYAYHCGSRDTTARGSLEGYRGETQSWDDWRALRAARDA